MALEIGRGFGDQRRTRLSLLAFRCVRRANKGQSVLAGPACPVSAHIAARYCVAGSRARRTAAARPGMRAARRSHCVRCRRCGAVDDLVAIALGRVAPAVDQCARWGWASATPGRRSGGCGGPCGSSSTRKACIAGGIFARASRWSAARSGLTTRILVVFARSRSSPHRRRP